METKATGISKWKICDILSRIAKFRKPCSSLVQGVCNFSATSLQRIWITRQIQTGLADRPWAVSFKIELGCETCTLMWTNFHVKLWLLNLKKITLFAEKWITWSKTFHFKFNACNQPLNTSTIPHFHWLFLYFISR